MCVIDIFSACLYIASVHVQCMLIHISFLIKRNMYKHLLFVYSAAQKIPLHYRQWGKMFSLYFNILHSFKHIEIGMHL